MPESELIDGLLKRSMTPNSAPKLSLEFEQRLANRLRPRRLSTKSRLLLAGYSILGLAISLWCMLASGMDWRVAALSVVVPLAVVGAIVRPFFRRFV